MDSSSKFRSSPCSFLNILLSFFNFIIFVFSAASVAPTIALKAPPTSFGWALLTISCISMLSSFTGFYSRLAHFCQVTHVSLLLASSVGQLLGILALFTKEKSSLAMLRSPRDPREAKLLVRLECGVLMAMFVMQLGVLVLSCVVHGCWVREYEGLDAEREFKAKELDEKMKNKYGSCVKNDFEG